MLTGLREQIDGEITSLLSGIITELGRFADQTQRAVDQLSQQERSGVRKIPRQT